MMAGITPEGSECMEGALRDLTRTDAVRAAAMNVFQGISTACELSCCRAHAMVQAGGWQLGEVYKAEVM